MRLQGQYPRLIKAMNVRHWVPLQATDGGADGEDIRVGKHIVHPVEIAVAENRRPVCGEACLYTDAEPRGLVFAQGHLFHLPLLLCVGRPTH